MKDACLMHYDCQFDLFVADFDWIISLMVVVANTKAS